MERLKNATTSIISFGQTVGREHSTALAVGGAGLALATAPVTGPAVLGAVGFSSTGPVAASLAAAWQSSIGVVQAGTWFATLQSAAMGGATAGTFTTASNIGIGIMGSAAVGTQLNDKKRRLSVGNDHDESQPADDYEYTASNPQTSDPDDSLDTEFMKLLKIDIS